MNKIHEIIGSNVPKLRFKNFQDPWAIKKLNEILKVKSKRNHDNHFSKEEVLSVSGDLGIINQIEHLGRSYAGANVDNYHVVEVGDVVYTKSPLKRNPYGIIKANKKYPGIVSTLYAVYEVKPGYDYKFIDRYFESNERTNKYLRPLVHKGAKNDMKINNERVLIDPIIVPDLPEQQKITAFLSSVDEWIENIRRQRDNLEAYKKGIMQKIFNQEIRFREENGKDFPAWKKFKFGEVFERVKSKNIEKNTNVLTISAQQGLVIQERFFTKSVSSENTSGYYLLHKGDFAYNKSYSNGYPMGAIKRLNLYEKGVVSPLYICFRLKINNQSSSFYEQYFDAGLMNKEIAKIAQEGARNHGLLNMSVVDFFADLFLTVPVHEEQQKIVDFLQSLDKKLDSKKMEIEKLEKWKKGLMQQLFI